MNSRIKYLVVMSSTLFVAVLLLGTLEDIWPVPAHDFPRKTLLFERKGKRAPDQATTYNGNAFECHW